MTELHLFKHVDMTRASGFEFATLRGFVCTAAKPGREGPNEDAAALIALDEGSVVAVISDGAGGHPDGAVAAGLAVDAICASVASVADPPQGLRSAIINGFEAANRAIAELGTGAAATLAVVEVQGSTMRAYHAGDSVVAVVGQRGRIKWQNIPHSPVGYAVEAGLLDRGDALHHEDLHLVSNLLGASDMRIELGPPVPLAMRDTVLLASDGLSDNLHFDEIVERIRKGPLSKVADALLTLGQARMAAPEGAAPSKPDDLAFIVLRQLHGRA
jgi:serine/threonine protein phosphatase PrpC